MNVSVATHKALEKRVEKLTKLTQELAERLVALHTILIEYEESKNVRVNQQS